MIDIDSPPTLTKFLMSGKFNNLRHAVPYFHYNKINHFLIKYFHEKSVKIFLKLFNKIKLKMKESIVQNMNVHILIKINCTT